MRSCSENTVQYYREETNINNCLENKTEDAPPIKKRLHNILLQERHTEDELESQ